MADPTMKLIQTDRPLSAVDIYLEMKQRLEQGHTAVMALIVKTRGSTPQREGARIVVFDDGTFIGTVGGGCIEADIYAEAKEVMHTGKAGIYHFSLAGDVAAEEGMVCGGQMDVFIERWSFK
jgi:xanthine dehydrogenase accessory factor